MAIELVFVGAWILNPTLTALSAWRFAADESGADRIPQGDPARLIEVTTLKTNRIPAFQDYLADDNALLHQLVTGSEYNEELALKIARRAPWAAWGGNEYWAVPKGVWNLNRRLPRRQPPLRVVALSCHWDAPSLALVNPSWTPPQIEDLLAQNAAPAGSGVPIPDAYRAVLAAKSNYTDAKFDTTATPLLPPDPLREDLEFLFRTVEESHPKIDAHLTKDQYSRVKDEIRRQVAHPMNLSEFYVYVSMALSCIHDDHTRVERPAGLKMPPVTESKRGGADRMANGRMAVQKTPDNRDVMWMQEHSTRVALELLGTPLVSLSRFNNSCR